MSASFLVCLVIAVAALVFWRATLVLAAAALLAILLMGIGVVADDARAGAQPPPAPSLTTPDGPVTPTPAGTGPPR